MALAGLREEQAPPEIAALYAALRQATGVPLVNLIHRHLATLPGVLPWVWQAIRPPLQDGSLAGARERLAAALPLPPLGLIPEAAWQAAGLAPADRPRIAALAEVYNRGNLTNLILLTALRRSLEGVPLEGAPAVVALPPPPYCPPRRPCRGRRRCPGRPWRWRAGWRRGMAGWRAASSPASTCISATGRGCSPPCLPGSTRCSTRRRWPRHATRRSGWRSGRRMRCALA
ncbi:hypothetical protein [Siccirubricoccus sp. G192]|uniref:hypothetical protein n=1 Tax=Siccirubricoccus sp. G192 TaxID=2849651 RepID=UPI001C2C398E|nr:hypothetical protein [Siccirubricoccus sp. G192]MBV1797911.1 hypothetical protein [Siccirubricoccus sp. G192]